MKPETLAAVVALEKEMIQKGEALRSEAEKGAHLDLVLDTEGCTWLAASAMLGDAVHYCPKTCRIILKPSEIKAQLLRDGRAKLAR